MKTIIVIIVIITMIAIGVNIIRKSKYDENLKQYSGFLLIIVSPIIGWILNGFIQETTPSAIDVYRGKTTLQITYQDSIPVDSIVVFKNKKNNYGKKKCGTISCNSSRVLQQ